MLDKVDIVSDGMKFQTISKMRDELKGLIRRWKKEADNLRMYEDSGDFSATLWLEKCAEDLEKTLLWY